jgi:hypothetical protein
MKTSLLTEIKEWIIGLSGLVVGIACVCFFAYGLFIGFCRLMN